MIGRLITLFAVCSTSALLAESPFYPASNCSRPSGADVARQRMREFRDARPVMHVFVQPGCAPCARWERDFDPRSPAGKKLLTCYQVKIIDISQDESLVERYELKLMPTIITPDRRHDGYSSAPDRIDAFLTEFDPRRKPPAPRQPELTPAPVAPPVFDREPLDRIFTRLDELRVDPVDLAQKVASRLPRPETLSRDDLHAAIAADRAPLLRKLRDVTVGIEELSREPRRQIVHQAVQKSIPEILGLAPEIAAGIGLTILTGGTTGTLYVALKFLGLVAGLRRRRPAYPPAPAGSPSVAPIIAAPAPRVANQPQPTSPKPPPQVIREDVRFTNIEVDTHSKAYAWAKQEMGKRFPGSIPTFEQLDGFIKQYLAGLPNKASS